MRPNLTIKICKAIGRESGSGFLTLSNFFNGKKSDCSIVKGNETEKNVDNFNSILQTEQERLDFFAFLMKNQYIEDIIIIFFFLIL